MTRQDRLTVQKECAELVCMYCGRRASGYSIRFGPNEAGNFIHKPLRGNGEPVLCRASAIWSQVKWDARNDEPFKLVHSSLQKGGD